MTDLIFSIALTMAGVVALAILDRTALKGEVRWRYVALALLGLAVYWLLIIVGADLQSRFGPEGLRWNWLGKLFTGAVLIGLLVFLPHAFREEAGFRLGVRTGSLGPCLVAAALMCLLSWGSESLAADGTDTSPERLLFQGLMPGLDEEIFFRGYFLALLARALPDRWTLAGAPMGPAGLIVTFVFAAGHGLGVTNGVIQFDALIFALTGLLGFGLLYIRQRSGSVAPAIIGHNLVNLGNSFF